MGILQPSDPVELPPTHRWTYEKIKPCISAGPYMIGAPPLGFDTHHPGKKTIPCYRRLRGCTLECPRCRFRSQYTAYVPLLNIVDPRKPRIVVSGGKKTWADVRGLTPGTLVRLNRGNFHLDTIRVVVSGEKLEPKQETVWRARCIEDISPYLFHLWQQRELTEHFGQVYYPSRRVIENEASEVPNSLRPDGDTIE